MLLIKLTPICCQLLRDVKKVKNHDQMSLFSYENELEKVTSKLLIFFL